MPVTSGLGLGGPCHSHWGTATAMQTPTLSLLGDGGPCRERPRRQRAQERRAPPTCGPQTGVTVLALRAMLSALGPAPFLSFCIPGLPQRPVPPHQAHHVEPRAPVHVDIPRAPQTPWFPPELPGPPPTGPPCTLAQQTAPLHPLAGPLHPRVPATITLLEPRPGLCHQPRLPESTPSPCRPGGTPNRGLILS